MRRKRQIRKRIAIILGVTLIAVLALYVGLSIFYNSHFFPKTVINGIDASNKTVDKVKELMQQELQGYELIILERDDVKECIGSTEIDMELIFDGSLERTLADQNGFAWVTAFAKNESKEMAKAVAYNESKLIKKLESLDCFDSEKVIEPKDASLSEYISGEGYSITKEEKGTLLDKDKVINVVEQAIVSLESQVSLEDNECYASPEILSDNEKLADMCETANKYVGSIISYDFDGQKEVINGDMIKDWLVFGDDYSVSIDTKGISDFVDVIGKRYNTIFTKRTFKTSYGKTIEIEGGDYGWWMNRGAECNELLELIREGAVVERKPVYFQEAASFGENDYGDSYIEINLTAQHLILYKDGEVVLQTDFVSGNSAKNYNTETGTFGITYKERYATLVGEDYETPVLYWMPFNGNVGLHDASWRYEFGKDLYQTSGSHGCINLPCQMARKIYENIEKGMAVIVYELPGSESKDTTTQTSAEVAEMVSHGIDEIGEVTERSKKALEWARAAYNELSEEEKKLVTNLNVLEEAEKAYAALKKN